MPIFKQMGEIIPSIHDTQLASGYSNINTWKVKAEQEKRQKEKEEKMKLMIAEANERAKTQKISSSKSKGLPKDKVEDSSDSA